MERRCPICKKIIKSSAREKPKFFPFCSERCKLIDLGAWLDAKYRIISKVQEEKNSANASDETSHNQHSKTS